MKLIQLYSILVVHLASVVLSQRPTDDGETSNKNCSTAANIIVQANSTLTRSNSNCEQLSTNDSVVCGSLQSATEMVIGLDCITIFISSGHHLVVGPVNFGATSVSLVGMNSDVTVLCDYELSSPEKQYTWSFNQSYEVRIENVNFMNCLYPLRMDTVRRINISNTSFMYFKEAVLDLFNCEEVLISNTLVTNNTGNGIVRQSFRGNTGGIAIGYSNIPSYFKTPIEVNLRNCEFMNNSATALLGSERAISRQIFLGRGGALGIYINSTAHNVTVKVSDSLFSDNFARVYGGGTFVLINAVSGTQAVVEYSRTEFTSNSGGFGAGAVFVGFLSSGSPAHPNTVGFDSCQFTNNTGESGGGMYVLTSFIASDGSMIRLERSNFTRNRGRGSQNDFGAAVAFAIFTIFRQRVTLSRHQVTDCVFHKNVGINGVFSIGYAPVGFSGVNQFTDNTGTALRITGSLVDIQGSMDFINNIAENDEGALTLLSFGQIRLARGVHMNFEGNIGRTGAGILVDTPSSIAASSQLLFNPMCFVLFENARLSPSLWNASVTFSDNTAVLGSAIYLSSIDTCSWFRVIPPFFNTSYFLDWPVWNFHDNVNIGYEDSLNPDYYVGTKAAQLSLSQNTVTAFPGQRFPLSLSGIDLYNHPTSTNARFLFKPNNSDYTDVVKFNPGIVVVAGSQNGTLVDEFQMQYSIPNSSVLDEISSGIVDLQEPFQVLPIKSDNLTLHLVPCPGGYYLRQAPDTGATVCACLDNGEIVNCENDQDSVILQHGLWASYTPTREPNLQFSPCPPSYCYCSHNSSLGPTRCVYRYTQSDVNLQCVDEREGVLCGGCGNGSGVSALLNKCVSCSNAFITLVVILIIIDVILFVGIILMDRPLPGLVYPLLFYVQLAPYVSQYFRESFEDVGKYLYFLGSGTSFYFIYDFCLFSSLPSLVSFFLRYLPVFTAAAVCPLVLIIRKKTKWKLLLNHGYWWLTVFLYSSVVHTSLSLLHCPQITNKDSSTSFRWFWSGEVQCFSGGHVPLFLLAIFMLLVCTAAIVLVVVLPLKRPRLTRKFIHPLTVSFRSGLEWWSGVELGRRLVFLLFFVSFPRNNVYASVVLVIVIALYGYAQPYRSKVANVLELVFQTNFLILILLESTALVRDSLFTFPVSTRDPSGGGTSPLTWLLLPFYYLPVAVFVLVCAAYGIHYLWNYRRKQAEQLQSDPPTSIDELLDSNYYTLERRVTSTTVDLDREEGQLNIDSGFVDRLALHHPES